MKAFRKGGVHAVILENNYNFPHKTTDETKEAVEMMTSLVNDLMEDSKLPFGISVLFNDYKSVNWVPYAIVPLKIYNTDAASGVQVMSKETRVFKNGRVWEKELFEIFYFDLEGKITSMTQYARDF